MQADDYKFLEPRLISASDAKRVVIARHYMKTFPQSAKICFGIFDKRTNNIAGVCVFGYSGATDKKVERFVGGLKRNEYIEMQRLWISDLYGHNTESFCLSKIMDKLKQETGLKLVITHAGGCKNDCGIVYQASGWVYLGKEPCNDFYLTTTNEYKNIASALRFGRVSAKGKTAQQVGEELFGKGKIIKSSRYFYIYPINKGIRRRLEKIALPNPKDSEVFRRDQKWCNVQ